MLNRFLIACLMLISGNCIADNCDQNWKPEMDVLTLRSVDDDRIFDGFIEVLEDKLRTDIEEAADAMLPHSDTSFDSLELLLKMEQIPPLGQASDNTTYLRINNYRDNAEVAQSYMNQNAASQMLAFQRVTDDKVSSVVFLGPYKGDIPDHVVPVFTDRQDATAFTSYANQYTVALLMALLEKSRKDHACNINETALLASIEERLASVPDSDGNVSQFLRIYRAAVERARVTP